MRTQSQAQRIPEGFAPIPTGSDFIRQLGPIYRGLIDNQAAYGLLIDARHANRSQNCHGGMLATIADMILIATCREHLSIPGPIPTVSLSLDFLAPVPVGSWVQGRGELIRATRSLIFARGELSLDGAPVLRFNGIFGRSQDERASSR